VREEGDAEVEPATAAADAQTTRTVSESPPSARFATTTSVNTPQPRKSRGCGQRARPYHEVGDSEVPLVLPEHFRGNLDNWHPALVDALAADRRVVAFDNVGTAARAAGRRTP
jgi:hypothetical protein